MHNSRLFASTCKVLSTPFKYKFHTTIQLQARFLKPHKKSLFKNKKDLDMGPMKLLYEDDLEYLENFENEDLDDAELGPMHLRETFDEHIEQAGASQKKMKRIKVAQKFFSSGKQPQMLTYNEKLCIKYLNEQDPLQWDVMTLSESFPATPDTITKILRGNWKASKERILKMDSSVQKNWKLLQEGKLDAEPKVLEHFKKFLNRREVLLEQIKNTKFYLPEIKKEKVWNNSEMSYILKSYEKEVKRLGNIDLKYLEADSADNKRGEQEKSEVLDKLSKKIKEKITKSGSQEKESFTYGKLLTHSEYEGHNDQIDNTAHKQQTQNKLDTNEKANLGYQKAKTEPIFLNICNQKSGIDKILTDDDSSNFNTSLSSEKKLEIKKSGKILDKNKHKLEELQRKYFLTEKKDTNYITKVGNRTRLLTELEVEKAVNKKEDTVSYTVKASVERFNKLISENPGRIDKDNCYYHNEVRDIQHTCFWDNKENSKNKAFRENEKNSPYAPPSKVTNTDKLEIHKYPEKIKIPKSQRGSGLTFKVNDCYYDDDGEFLYRVPGMKI